MNTKGSMKFTTDEPDEAQALLVAVKNLLNTFPFNCKLTVILGEEVDTVTHFSLPFASVSFHTDTPPLSAAADGFVAEADPPPVRPAAVGAELSVPGWSELTYEQQEIVDRLMAGTLTWLQLERADKAAILTAVLVNLTNQFEQKLSMQRFNEMRPTWLPTASSLAAMFADQQWKTLLNRAAERTIQ